jgi:hypothetical protein
MLACDTSEMAISAVLRCRKGEGLTLLLIIVAGCLLLREGTHSVGRNGFAVVFGCEEFRSYLEHKEFTLHADNQSLSYLCCHAKESDRIGHRMLFLALFEFRVYHTAIKTNLVVDGHWDLDYLCLKVWNMPCIPFLNQLDVLIVMRFH